MTNQTDQSIADTVAVIKQPIDMHKNMDSQLMNKKQILDGIKAVASNHKADYNEFMKDNLAFNVVN